VFDRAALDAVARFKYRPKVIDGTPVPVTVRHRITFELQGS
jgi:protein TonB